MNKNAHSMAGKTRSDKKVFAVIGDERVFNSRAPFLFSSVMEKAGINGTCVPLRVDEGKVKEALQGLKNLNIAGASITIPHKEAVIPHLDQVSEGANIIGAINTVVISEDQIKGYNTNAIGFMNTLTEMGFDPSGKNAVVFGPGGGARAAVFMLNWLKMDRIFISSVNKEKAKNIAENIAGEPLAVEDLLKKPLVVDLIVNASPLSGVDEGPKYANIVSALDIPRCRLIVDFNYGRKRNFFRQKAQMENIDFAEGLTTLAHQARNTLALWTGVDLPVSMFKQALKKLKT